MYENNNDESSEADRGHRKRHGKNKRAVEPLKDVDGSLHLEDNESYIGVDLHRLQEHEVKKKHKNRHFESECSIHQTVPKNRNKKRRHDCEEIEVLDVSIPSDIESFRISESDTYENDNRRKHKKKTKKVLENNERIETSIIGDMESNGRKHQTNIQSKAFENSGDFIVKLKSEVPRKHKKKSRSTKEDNVQHDILETESAISRKRKKKRNREQIEITHFSIADDSVKTKRKNYHSENTSKTLEDNEESCASIGKEVTNNREKSSINDDNSTEGTERTRKRRKYRHSQTDFQENGETKRENVDPCRAPSETPDSFREELTESPKKKKAKKKKKRSHDSESFLNAKSPEVQLSNKNRIKKKERHHEDDEDILTETPDAILEETQMKLKKKKKTDKRNHNDKISRAITPDVDQEETRMGTSNNKAKDKIKRSHNCKDHLSEFTTVKIPKNDEHENSSFLKEHHCQTLTQEERGMIGPVWKNQFNVDGDDVSENEEISHLDDADRIDEWEFSDFENDSESCSDDEVRTKSNRLCYHLRPNMDPEDYEPITEGEMEMLLDIEIVVDWPLMPLHALRIFVSDKELMKQAEAESAEMGICRRRGRLTLEERRIIVKNIEEFRELYGVRNPLYHVGNIESKLTTNEKLKFTRFIARGLENRRLLSVRVAAMVMLSPYTFNSVKRNEKYMKSIEKLVGMHGRKWTKLGKIMKYRNWILRQDYAKKQRPVRLGKWSVGEYKRLIAAMVSLTGERDLRKLHHNLPWTKASEIVGTRDLHQCREAWLHVLTRTIMGISSRDSRWNTEKTIRLIEMLHDGQYTTELDIPWSDMFEDFSYYNCAQLISQWHVIRRQVPGYQLMTYEEQMEYLVKHKLPVFNAKLKAKLEKVEIAAANRLDFKRRRQMIDAADESIVSFEQDNDPEQPNGKERGMD